MGQRHYSLEDELVDYRERGNIEKNISPSSKREIVKWMSCM